MAANHCLTLGRLLTNLCFCNCKMRELSKNSISQTLANLQITWKGGPTSSLQLSWSGVGPETLQPRQQRIIHPPKMSIVPKLRILGLQVFSISVILLHRASKCFTRNLHAMKGKLFSTVFTSLGLNSPGIKSPSFQMAVHYDAGLLHEQSCSISFNSACVVLEFCYLITATNNGTCTYSGCLGSKDTHYCLNLSFSRLQAHKT